MIDIKIKLNNKKNKRVLKQWDSYHSKAFYNALEAFKWLMLYGH